MPESKVAPPKKEKRERKLEPIGSVVVCRPRSYQVEGLLAAGTFVDVYQVHLRSSTDKKYAMKTDRFEAMRGHPNKWRLNNESKVYEDIQSEDTYALAIPKTHFAKMLDYAASSYIHFLIMEIVGPSLKDIRGKMMKFERSSPHTVATIARQTLASIEALHAHGWLHGDIKPSSFAIGLAGRKPTILLLNFGLARRYTQDNWVDVGLTAVKQMTIIPPRGKRVTWLGTQRYASARALQCQEQARRDDCESWCYMIMEYYWARNLVWNYGDFGVKMQIGMKIAIMNDPMANLKKGHVKMPQRFCDIITMVNKLTYEAAPDYRGMHSILEQIIKDEKIDMSLPLDWAGKRMPPDLELEQLRASMTVMDEYDDKAVVPDLLAERREKLERDMMQLYKDMGKPKTLAEVQEEIRRTVKKKANRRREESNEDDSGSERSEDSEDERERRRRRKKDASQKAMKEKRDDIQYQLHYIAAELDDAGAPLAHTDYRKLADEAYAVQDEAVIHKLWTALKNPIIYIMDEKRKTIAELREIINGKAEEAKSPRTKRIKGKKDEVKARLRFIANSHYKRRAFDRCEDYVLLAEEVGDVQNEAVLDKMQTALNSASLKAYLEDDDKKRFSELKQIVKVEQGAVKDSKGEEEKIKLTKEMVRAQLVVIAARHRSDPGETVEYLKLADELKDMNNQALLDRMHQALDNYETYMDDQTMLRALKEIKKEEKEKGGKADKKPEVQCRRKPKAGEEKRPKDEKRNNEKKAEEKEKPSPAQAPAATKAAEDRARKA